MTHNAIDPRLLQKLKKGESFCALPWVEDFWYIDGKKYFCCMSDVPLIDKQSSDALREKIWAGEKVENCTKCYELENKNVISPRQKETFSVFKDLEIRNHFLTDHSPEYHPFFIDLRVDNKCNLACISCHPDTSSLWAKELNIPIQEVKHNIDYNTILQSKKLYMAGGEPLIIDEYLKIINLIADKNPDIELVINTNLTSIDDATIGSIKKIKKASLIISVDSFGAVNEYHRYPLKWDKFTRNLDAIADSKIPVSFNTVIDAVSIFGFDNLHLLEHYPHHWNLCILTTPHALMLKNIPVHLKELARKKLKNLENTKFYKSDIKFRSTVDSCVLEINKDGDSKELSQYIQSIDNRRKINHENYLGVNLIEQ